MLSRADILPHVRHAELKEFRKEIGEGDFLVLCMDGASGPIFTVVTSVGFDLIGTEYGGVRGRLKLSAILEGGLTWPRSAKSRGTGAPLPF